MKQLYRHPGIDSVKDYISICVDLVATRDVRRFVANNFMYPVYDMVGTTEYLVHSTLQNKSLLL